MSGAHLGALSYRENRVWGRNPRNRYPLLMGPNLPIQTPELLAEQSEVGGGQREGGQSKST